jgi:hypothetical protein
MSRWLVFLTVFFLTVKTPGVFAQSALPRVEDVEAGPLRRQCEVLLDALGADDYPALARLARAKDPLPADYGQAVQEALDPQCLIGVTINPESRVKAARGPRVAELVRGQDTLVLVKIQNDAGVTQGLKVSGAQLRAKDDASKDRWLEASVHARKPLANKLTGQRLEYVVLRLKAHETGKREATLKFDVGQGTQDLGFRAEVPILFTIRAPK